MPFKISSIVHKILINEIRVESFNLCTNLIFRWEISALDQFPEYMKLCYQAVLDVYSMIDEEMVK